MSNLKDHLLEMINKIFNNKKQATLNQDTRDRQITTFLSRKNIIAGYKLEKILNDVFKGNNPILIQLLPSNQNEPYYQQLSAECFQNGNRPDLDIMDTIQKARVFVLSSHLRTSY